MITDKTLDETLVQPSHGQTSVDGSDAQACSAEGRAMSRHPIQPLQDDGKGVLRFKENGLVRYILDHGGVDLNHLARLDFTREDREQFAQLIGYSLSGYADLSYVTNETYAAAQALNENLEVSALEARIAHLEGVLQTLRDGLREPLAELYECHPDDFGFK